MSNEKTATTSTVNTVTNDENEKKNLIEAIKKLLQGIAQALMNFKNHNSIVDRLENIEQRLDDNDLDTEMLNDIYEMTSEVSGKLNTINPNNVNEIKNLAEGVVKGIEEKIALAIKDNFIDSKASLENINQVLNNPSIDEEKFISNARIISCPAESNYFLIEIDKQIVRAEYTLSDTEDGTKVQIEAKKDNLTYEDVFENGKLRNNYNFVEEYKDANEEYNAMLTLYNAICKVNGKEFYRDKEQAIGEAEKKAKEALPPQAWFLKTRSEQVTLSGGENDKRYESKYYDSDFSFRIRDTKTGHMFYITCDDDSINLSLCPRTKSIEEIPTSPKLLGGWFQKEGKYMARIQLPKDESINEMIRCSELDEWLMANGINRKDIKKIFDTDVPKSKVSKKGMEKVYKLREVLTQNVYSYGYDVDYVEEKTSKDEGFSTLQVCDNSGNRMAYTFDKTGNPTSVEYCKKGNKEFTFIRDLQTMRSSDMAQELSKDPKFQRLLNIMTNTVKGAKQFTPKANENQSQSPKEIKKSIKEMQKESSANASSNSKTAESNIPHLLDDNDLKALQGVISSNLTDVATTRALVNSDQSVEVKFKTNERQVTLNIKDQNNVQMSSVSIDVKDFLAMTSNELDVKINEIITPNVNKDENEISTEKTISPSSEYAEALKIVKTLKEGSNLPTEILNRPFDNGMNSKASLNEEKQVVMVIENANGEILASSVLSKEEFLSKLPRELEAREQGLLREAIKKENTIQKRKQEQERE